MKSVFILAVMSLFVLMVMAYPTADQLGTVPYSFEQYVVEFEKDYFLTNNITELNKRREIFEKNMMEIIEFNAQGHSWKQGINQFTDLTLEEFLERYTGETPFEDLQHLNADESHDDNLQYDPLIAHDNYPRSVDWSSRNLMAKEIRSQGACGSCYSFAAVTTLEMYLKASIGKEIRLSTQQSVDCLDNPRECGGTGGCGGYAATAVLEYATSTGLQAEEDYPYESGETRTAGECRLNEDKIVMRAKGTRRIKMNDVNDLMKHIAYYGAVAISVDATKMKAYESGVLTECHRDFVDDHGLYEVTTNHAVVLVGYGVDEDGVGYWKYRNSWGAKWGMNGHGHIYRATNGEKEREFINMNPHAGTACKDEPNTPFIVAGSCGVLWNAWVPVGVHGV